MQLISIQIQRRSAALTRMDIFIFAQLVAIGHMLNIPPCPFQLFSLVTSQKTLLPLLEAAFGPSRVGIEVSPIRTELGCAVKVCPCLCPRSGIDIDFMDRFMTILVQFTAAWWMGIRWLCHPQCIIADLLSSNMYGRQGPVHSSIVLAV